MLLVYKKGLELYVKVELDLRLPVRYENKVFEKGQYSELLLPEEVMHLLTVNGRIRLYDGRKYIRLNLGQFYDIITNKKYRVEDYIEPVKQKVIEEPKVEVKKEEPKVEPKKEEKVEEKPVEVKQEQKHHDNKKQRHNNNNKQNNNQGGDK